MPGVRAVLPRARWARAAVIVVLCIAAWMLLVYAADGPITVSYRSGCAICRASKENKLFYLIPLPPRIEETEFSRYYHDHVDPAHHRHVWLGLARTIYTRTGGTSGHGGPGPFRLYYEAAFSILKSLPDAESRKAFCEGLYQVYAAKDGSAERRETWIEASRAVMTLNEAYWENEHRKDWPEQLKKVGLYPGQTSKRTLTTNN